jgi:hypothetical protein
MPFRHGKNTKVLVGSHDLSSYFAEASVAGSIETAETTTFGVTGGAKTYVAGLNDATLSLSGMYDGDAGSADDVIETALGSDEDINFTVAIDGGMLLGSRCVIGQTIETKYDVTSPVADVVKTSAEFQFDAGASRGVVLAPLSSISSTSFGSSVDNAASTTNGGIAMLHVPANTRNGNITIKVQHSSDNSTFADLATFSVVSSATATSERISIASGTTVNRYLRTSFTVAGSTGSATIACAFARRY